jgi:hypothetical protein
LTNGFKDADLFEWSCFSAICNVLAGDLVALKNGHAAINAGRYILVNTNRPGGLAITKKMLPGWRDSSVMPSGYKPDFIVAENAKNFVVPIDAKFRVGASLEVPCSADSVKEVQAYLDEFGLNGAIILVPAIPFSLASGDAKTYAIKIEGCVLGRTRRIWVVEYAPSLHGFEERFLTALDDLLSLSRHM